MNSDFSDFIRFFPIFRLFPTFRLLDSTTLVYTDPQQPPCLDNVQLFSISFAYLVLLPQFFIWFAVKLSPLKKTSIPFDPKTKTFREHAQRAIPETPPGDA